MTIKDTKEVVEFIASFLLDRTGNEIFDKAKEKKRIKKVLKKDGENIKRIFFTIHNSDLYNLIEEFIIFSAFKDPIFYSPMNLTEKQEEDLWEEFAKYLEKENGTKIFEIDKSYKDKIIKCINLHNESLNNIILSDNDKIQMKMIVKQNHTLEKSLRNTIIDTLNTETRLQENDDELNFVIEELECIMKSYRFDINQLRRFQLLCMCAAMLILLILTISIPLSLKFITNPDALLITVFLLFIFALIVFFFWCNISPKLRRLESDLEGMRNGLVSIHMQIYSNLVENRYMCKKNILKSDDEKGKVIPIRKDQDID